MRKSENLALWLAGAYVIYQAFNPKYGAAQPGLGQGSAAARVGGDLIGLSYGDAHGMAQAAMGAHLTPKNVGGAALVITTWAGTTRNALNVGIPWTYRLGVTLYIDGQVGPWPIGYSVPVNAPYLTQVNTPQQIAIPPTFAVGARLSVKSELQALQSDANGNEVPNSWATLRDSVGTPISLVHLDAILVASGAASPSAGLSAVNVNQSALRRMMGR